MSEEKIYIGSGKEKTFQDGGSLVNVMLDLDGIGDLFKNYGFTTQQGKKKLRIIVQKKRQPDQYGNTHAVTVDTWKPTQGGGQGQGQPQGNPQQSGGMFQGNQGGNQPNKDDDIPFF